MEVKRELIKETLLFLETHGAHGKERNWLMYELQAALLAPEKAPVAWLNHYAGMPPRIDSAATAGALRSEPLYLHPSAPERKPMTLDEIKSNPVIRYFGVDSGEKIVRAVEAFHGVTK